MKNVRFLSVVLLMQMLFMTPIFANPIDKGLLASYFTGYGAEALSNIVLDDWGTEYAKKKLNELGIKEKSRRGEFVNNQVKIVASSIGKAFEESVGQSIKVLLKYLDLDAQNAQKISNAFDAGTRLPLLFNAAIVPTLGSVIKLGLQLLGGQPTQYLFDILNPPIKTYHGTVQYCGQNKYHCQYEQGVKYFYCHPGISDPRCLPIKHFYCEAEDPACKSLLSLDALLKSAKNYGLPVADFVMSATVGFVLSHLTYSAALYAAPAVTNALTNAASHPAMHAIIKTACKKFFDDQAWQLKEIFFALMDDVSGQKPSAWLVKHKKPFKYGRYEEKVFYREQGKIVKMTVDFLKDLGRV